MGAKPSTTLEASLSVINYFKNINRYTLERGFSMSVHHLLQAIISCRHLQGNIEADRFAAGGLWRSVDSGRGGLQSG